MKKLFLGIKGHVVCLNKETGQELWRKKLKIDWGKPTIVVFSEDLFVYVTGTLFCLSSKTGEIKWQNSLKKLGSGHCVIAIEGQNSELTENSSDQVLGDIVESVVDIST